MLEKDMSLSRPVKRTKSRNGCSSCKIRHLKCGEEKPICVRCSAAGITCEGYGYQVTPKYIHTVSPHALGSSRSSIDNRCFGYFRYNAISGLMGFNYHSNFWNEMVLQFCEASPAVLHAAIALSSLHEQLYNQGGSIAISKSNSMFLQQYNKSIKHLRSRESTQPVQITLTCCILFICLENLAGNYDTALAHLKNGLNILQDWHAKGAISASDDQIREKITQAFRRLDMQATVFLNSRVPQINATSIGGNAEEDKCSPASFTSLGEAQTALEMIQMRLFYVLTVKSSPDIPSYSLLNKFLPTREILLPALGARLKQWKEAFDALSACESATMQTKDLQLSVLLGLHYLTISTMLEVGSRPLYTVTVPHVANAKMSRQLSGGAIFMRPPDPSDDFKFRKINELSKSLINSVTKATFSADIGVIAPLYFSAVEAPDSNVRQQAIELLRLVKWKEGFWCAETAATIAEKALQAKETTGIQLSGGVPELAKVYCVN